MFGHVTDIGGKVACSMPNDAHSIFEVSNRSNLRDDICSVRFVCIDHLDLLCDLTGGCGDPAGEAVPQGRAE